MHTSADLGDVEEFLSTWDQDGSEAAELIEKHIGTDEVTEFLQKGVGAQNSVIMRAAAEKILRKS